MNDPPKRGEVWVANFSPTVGREQKGDRPALVISDDRLNRSPAGLSLVVPLTTTERGIPWHVRIPPSDEGVRKMSFALCEQMRSISTRRLDYRMGKVKPETMQEVEDRLRVLLGME